MMTAFFNISTLNNKCINNPNVKGTLLKGLISKPVAEGKGVNKKIKIKKGNESKFDSQTLRFFPPSKQDYNSL